MRRVLLVMVVFGVGCGTPAVRPDGGGADVDAGDPDGGEDGGDGGGAEDAGADAGSPDASVPDDAGSDGGLADGGAPDSGMPDAGPSDAGYDDAGCMLPDLSGPAFRLRAVAANLSSGNAQSYDPGHGQRILQGLQPDLVMIQEFNYGTNSVADVSSFVSATFDGGYSYVRGVGQIPNGVISRWPIVASGEWVDPQVGNRRFTWAKVDLPGPRDVWVVSLHLLTSNAGDRNLEAQALVADLATGVPAGDFLLVGGDFNTDTRTEAALSTLSSRVITAAPFPADQQGVDGTNASRSKPYDWVLASRCLKPSQVPVAIGAGSYAAGLVVDTRVYTPIGDLAPALSTDSAAPSMQHMAVVKDFTIQP